MNNSKFKIKKNLLLPIKIIHFFILSTSIITSSKTYSEESLVNLNVISDVNCDDNVNIIDLVLTIKIIFKDMSIPPEKCLEQNLRFSMENKIYPLVNQEDNIYDYKVLADTNCDRTLDIHDVSKQVSYILQEEEALLESEDCITKKAKRITFKTDVDSRYIPEVKHLKRELKTNNTCPATEINLGDCSIIKYLSDNYELCLEEDTSFEEKQRCQEAIIKNKTSEEYCNTCFQEFNSCPDDNKYTCMNKRKNLLLKTQTRYYYLKMGICHAEKKLRC